MSLRHEIIVPADKPSLLFLAMLVAGCASLWIWGVEYIGGIVGASVTVGFVASGADKAFALVHWDQIGTIVLSWIVSPLLGGSVAFLLFRQIKRHILHYNERAQASLEEIRREREAHKERHITAFERLTELQQISYTQAMARDAAALNLEQGRGPDDFESEYYRGLFAIELRRNQVDAYRALQTYVPVLAALGSMIIAAMLLFKGLEHMNLRLSDIDNYLPSVRSRPSSTCCTPARSILRLRCRRLPCWRSALP